jgi:DNA repair exonuclease SbcCD nuclease subunit
MLRFIHCADLHFDRSFEGLHLVSETKSLADSNGQVLENIVNLALEEEVDFMLFAGDTFHQNRPTLKTQHQFFQQMERLNQQDIPVYLIFGNHDYYEAERYWFEFPENVHLFVDETVTTLLGQTTSGESYAISGFSYLHPWIQEAKVSEFPTRQAKYHIGMYHGDNNGSQYAPFQISEMKQKNYDYWALGHVHIPTVLSQQPPVIYPGTPQGHTQKEQQVAGVQLITLNEMETTFETREVAAIQWTETKISLKSIRKQQAALDRIIENLENQAKQLIKVILVDTEELPKNWLNNKEKSEIIAYLNDVVRKKANPPIVYQIEIKGEEFESIQLSGKEVLSQILAAYQDERVFTTIVEELASHPLIQRTLAIEELKETTLNQVKEKFQREFHWREADK